MHLVQPNSLSAPLALAPTQLGCWVLVASFALSCSSADDQSSADLVTSDDSSDDDATSNGQDDSEDDDSFDESEDDDTDDDTDDDSDDSSDDDPSEDDGDDDDDIEADAGAETATDAGAAFDAGAALPDLALADIEVSTLLTPEDADYGTLSPIEAGILDSMAPCAGAISSGQQIRWTPSQDGTLTVRVETDAPHVSLLQTDCGVQNTTKTCVQPGQVSEISTSLVAGVPICLVVGYDGNAVIQARVGVPQCGDGVVNPASEACDDGDNLPGDGCGAECQFEPVDPEDGDQCPGEAHTLSTQLNLSGFTVGYSDQAPVACGALPSASDKVYAIIPDADGTLIATASADFDLVLSTFTSCNDNRLEDLLACSDHPIATADESVRFPVEDSVPYYVVVDAYSATQQGRYELQLELQTDR